MSDYDKPAALYARVSTENQSLDEQVEKLKSWAEKNGHKHKVYKERASAARDSDRREFDRMMDNLDDHSFLAITRLDRFGRSLRQMLMKIDEVNELCDGLVVIDDQFRIDTRGERTLQQKIMTQFLSLFADVERRMIRQRMKIGYEQAMEDGRVGRPEALSEEEKEELVALYESGRFTWDGLEEKFGVSRSTVSKVLNEKGVL